jgi:predicted DNA-binding transcriptional regulator YafY
MDDLKLIATALILMFYLWSVKSGRKIKARIERIRKVHGPDAKMCYMDLHGKRSAREITIESVKPQGRDFIVIAWCHQKKEFLEFHASRMYEYVDMHTWEEVTNVPNYFAEHYGAAAKTKPKAQEQESQYKWAS